MFLIDEQNTPRLPDEPTDGPAPVPTPGLHPLTLYGVTIAIGWIVITAVFLASGADRVGLYVLAMVGWLSVAALVAWWRWCRQAFGDQG